MKMLTGLDPVLIGACGTGSLVTGLQLKFMLLITTLWDLVELAGLDPFYCSSVHSSSPYFTSLSMRMLEDAALKALLAKAKINNIHCLPLTQQTNNFFRGGYWVGET